MAQPSQQTDEPVPLPPDIKAKCVNVNQSQITFVPNRPEDSSLFVAFRVSVRNKSCTGVSLKARVHARYCRPKERRQGSRPCAKRNRYNRSKCA